MRDYNPEEVLISIHIPKCGGSSLAQILKNWFGDKLYFNYYQEVSNLPPVPIDFARAGIGTCIHGHFNKKRDQGVSTLYPEAKQFMTFLRNPAEIQISNYFYVKERVASGQSFKNGKIFDLPFNSIDDYLVNTHSGMLNHFPDGINEDNYTGFLESNFIFVGIMEDFQRSVDRLARKLDKMTFPVPQVNTAKREHAASDEAIRMFKANHKFEYELYQYCADHIVNGRL